MSMQILVVDDQPLIRSIHSKMLTDAGYKLQTAKDGKEGLEIYRKHKNENNPFDMIMTDEEMPQMTGVQMSEIIFKEEPGIPIAMISSVEDMELMERLMKMGITFFRKPLRKHDLYPFLENIEKKVKVKKESEQKEKDKNMVESFLSAKGVELMLNNDVNIHPQVMKYILDFCEENQICEEISFRIHFGLTECLINAVAHGNLEMGSKEYKKEGNFDKWEQELATRMNQEPYRDRKVRVYLWVEPPSKVVLTIEDEGKGFDYNKILAKITPDDIYQAFGRGLVMLDKVADNLNFNEKGNRITMTFLERSED